MKNSNKPANSKVSKSNELDSSKSSQESKVLFQPQVASKNSQEPVCKPKATNKSINAQPELGNAPCEPVLCENGKNHYPNEFKLYAVELYSKTSDGYTKLCNKLGICDEKTLREWVTKYNSEGKSAFPVSKPKKQVNDLGFDNEEFKDAQIAYLTEIVNFYETSLAIKKKT